MINYQVQLQTDLSLQLQAELSLETETAVRLALEKWLSPVFTDKAKDVDLRFYSSETDAQKYAIHDIINDSRTSYTIQLPKQNYMHLGVANMEGSNHLRHLQNDHSVTSTLKLNDASVYAPLNTGVFTARLSMDVNDTTQSFHVHLYMVNSAVAVVIDTTACDSLVSVSGIMLGSADEFAIRDSAFSFTKSPVFRMEQVPVTAASLMKPKSPRAFLPNFFDCLGTVCLTTQPEKPWTIQIVATLKENRHTTTTLTIPEYLPAGTLRVLKLTMDAQGGIKTGEDSEIGASIELDWKSGGEHTIDI